MTIICALHEPGVGTWIGSDTMAIRDGLRSGARIVNGALPAAIALDEGCSGEPFVHMLGLPA